MLLYFVIFWVFNRIFVSDSFIQYPGSRYPPTKGEVWPKPQHEIKEFYFYTFNPRYKINHHAKNYWTDFDETYSGFVLLFTTEKRFTFIPPDGLAILSITAGPEHNNASDTAVMAALCINGTQIWDYPRYAHRGLLLDTSRHYISMFNILRTLDAMAMNKMNVFHWHIVDDQSFPYESEVFPDLSKRGAFHSSMVYTKHDIEIVVQYARDRGIRVVPEFHVPGHSRSWGVAYPKMLSECYLDGMLLGLGPMNPARNFTYKLLQELFHEVQTRFPDDYIHIGGNEVDLSCWRLNPEVRNYMTRRNLGDDANKLHADFMQNTITLLVGKSKPIVWQSVYSEELPIFTLLQVSKSNFSTGDLVRGLKSGHQVLFSWFLDRPDKGFQDFYTTDPRQMVYDALGNDSIIENIVGGEACIWTEMLDDRNVLSWIWPDASAIAERLWSAGLGRSQSKFWPKLSVPREVLHRMEEHICRMIRRKIPAMPSNGPGFCVLLES